MPAREVKVYVSFEMVVELDEEGPRTEEEALRDLRRDLPHLLLYPLKNLIVRRIPGRTN